MPVPTTFSALSTTPASNSPAGSDAPSVLDDHQRALYAFIASIYANSGNGWTTPYLPLAGGTITGAVGFSGAGAITGYATTSKGTWTPTATNLTVVGTPTYQGWYTQINDRVLWELYITVAGGTTASTANSTYFTGLPGTNLAKTTCVAVQDSGTASLGVGLVDVTTNRVYTPTWAATSSGILVSGSYRV